MLPPELFRFKLESKILTLRSFLFFFAAILFGFSAYPAFCNPSIEGLGSLELITDEVRFPSNIVSIPNDDRNRIFILEKDDGRIRVIENGQLSPDVFLDIGEYLGETNLEQGLLGLAFPPDFKKKKHVYITYTDWKEDPEKNSDLVLSRFQVSEDGKNVIKSSEEKLLVAKNYVSNSSSKGYHYCGHIKFAPKSDYLYLCVGDSDNQGNPKGTAQNLGLIQGKILRLDVESGKKPYGIPPDNPFVSTEGARPEIWAYGLRNPWRFSFDPLTGDMFIPDAGWNFFEELNFQSASSKGGENYGWNFAEGNECHKVCDGKLEWPIHEYPHLTVGCAVIGGMVYRGEKLPEWNGVYLFGDFCRGQIWAIRNFKSNPEIRLILSKVIGISAISPDSKGEVLVADGRGGKVYRFGFPAYDNDHWKSLKEYSAAMILDSRRSGLVASNLHAIIDDMEASRRWRYAKPLVEFYNWIGRPFD